MWETLFIEGKGLFSYEQEMTPTDYLMSFLFVIFVTIGFISFGSYKILKLVKERKANPEKELSTDVVFYGLLVIIGSFLLINNLYSSFTSDNEKANIEYDEHCRVFFERIAIEDFDYCIEGEGTVVRDLHDGGSIGYSVIVNGETYSFYNYNADLWIDEFPSKGLYRLYFITDDVLFNGDGSWIVRVDVWRDNN